MEGFGSASFEGPEAILKGKFAFGFRRPGLGRIEALDPLGRTVFYLFLEAGRAAFVLPGEKAYAEDEAEAVMVRLLGFSLLPDDMIRILGGAWPGPDEGQGAGWSVERDEQGRVAGGVRGDLRFTVRSFFKGGGVPRQVEFSRPGLAGRLKILSLRFDPPVRAGAFRPPFLSRYARKTWEEMEELLKR